MEHYILKGLMNSGPDEIGVKWMECDPVNPEGMNEWIN